MPFKRKVTKKVPKKYVKKSRAVSANTVKAIVNKALNKKIETKSACSTTADYSQIGHNSFISLAAGDLLATTQGILDPNSSVLASRIGDQITLKNISIRMMIELNERYSQCTYRILLIKASKADSLSTGFLFCGLSGNKMLDRIDKERYTVLFEKWGQIKNDTAGGGRQAVEDATVAVPSTGLYQSNISGPQYTFSRVTKIVKFNLPGKLFGKGGRIQYENGSSQVKNWDYHLLIYAYSNYSTSQLLGYNVLAVNECVKEMYFQDA